jgi:tellurite resistance protein TerC
MSHQVVMWVGFNLFVLAMLALDLGVLHRKAHVVTAREALVWSAVWIALALLFDVGVYFWYGPEPALDFLTGYLIEKSLSVDNIFVFLLIFSAFRVPSQYQHTVLFWGIVGALLMRALFIAIGITLLQTFHCGIHLRRLFTPDRRQNGHTTAEARDRSWTAAGAPPVAALFAHYGAL